jgi:hypothetical protein
VLYAFFPSQSSYLSRYSNTSIITLLRFRGFILSIQFFVMELHLTRNNTQSPPFDLEGCCPWYRSTVISSVRNFFFRLLYHIDSTKYLFITIFRFNLSPPIKLFLVASAEPPITNDYLPSPDKHFRLHPTQYILVVSTTQHNSIESLD